MSITSNGHRHVPPARSQEERELERVQRLVTQGQLADDRRRKLIVSLHAGGMTQVEIAARLSRASLAVGGEPVGEDAVNKLVKRMRMKGIRQ